MFENKEITTYFIDFTDSTGFSIIVVNNFINDLFVN